MAEILMGIAVLASGVIGGVTSAQNYCKYESQIGDTITQTNKFITSATAAYNAIVAQETVVTDDTKQLQIAAVTATNNLLSLRQNYVNTLKRYHIIALFIIVIVFILLLAKKLKVY
jgi:hypothetical protein